MSRSIIVLGAGMVGVACALSLRRRGHIVTLIDRRGPGEETSFGNAGVLSRGSVLAFNNPDLWAKLPRYLRNSSPALRHHPLYLAKNARWFARFLMRARREPMLAAASALNDLIAASLPLHRQWIGEAGAGQRLRESGWLRLWRSDASFAASALERELLDRFAIAHEVLDAAAIRDLEPHLKPIFARGIRVAGTATLDQPGAVVAAYAQMFAGEGGRLVRAEALDLKRQAAHWDVLLADGTRLAARDVVVALGPWAPVLMRRLGLRIPMAMERGYHHHYAAAGNATLSRAVCDVDASYSLSPMANGYRLTTGVELADRDAAPNPAQIELARRAADDAFPLAEALDPEPWLGRRPSLPDSLPMIGAVLGQRGLWCAFGHQHIGVTTAPGTARLLAALMHDDAPPFDPAPFRPARFLR